MKSSFSREDRKRSTTHEGRTKVEWTRLKHMRSQPSRGNRDRVGDILVYDTQGKDGRSSGWTGEADQAEERGDDC
jgi:hypothetical protein